MTRPITNQIANRSQVSGVRNVISQIEKIAPMIGTTGMPGVLNVRGRSGCL